MLSPIVTISPKSLLAAATFSLLTVLFVSCGNDYVPKPRAYNRIEFPEKAYQRYDNGCPYTFEYPTYGQIVADRKGDEKYCWVNVNYKPFNANLHISYKPIVRPGDFQHLLTDAYTFVEKHNSRAEAITEERVSNGKDAHGLIFRIGGNTASNVQFFLTDSSEHFFRASLYFNAAPNKDSLAPIVDFIGQDIEHLIKTFEWTDVRLKEFR